jgi:hypothetical protein
MDAKKYYLKRFLRHAASFPFIWMTLIPFLLADLILEIYHRVCFPLYGVAYVKRRHYITIDRHRLKYLTWNEKIGCAYCGYTSGWLAYATEITARTEQYWCGIKHQQRQEKYQQPHHQNFVEYGDKDSFMDAYSNRKK